MYSGAWRQYLQEVDGAETLALAHEEKGAWVNAAMAWAEAGTVLAALTRHAPLLRYRVDRDLGFLSRALKMAARKVRGHETDATLHRAKKEAERERKACMDRAQATFNAWSKTVWEAMRKGAVRPPMPDLPGCQVGIVRGEGEGEALPTVEGATLRWADIQDTVAALQRESTPTFQDLVGSTALKRRLVQDFLLPLLLPDFAGRAGRARGLLLFGPPGTGKTNAVHALFHQMQRLPQIHPILFPVRPSDIKARQHGGTPKNMRMAFSAARALVARARAAERDKKGKGGGRRVVLLMYFDEAEALLARRDGPGGRGAAAAVPEFLVQTEGRGAEDRSNDGIFYMASTNLPGAIDPAVLRRLGGTRVFVPLPNVADVADMVVLAAERRLRRILDRFLPPSMLPTRDEEQKALAGSKGGSLVDAALNMIHGAHRLPAIHWLVSTALQGGEGSRVARILLQQFISGGSTSPTTTFATRLVEWVAGVPAEDEEAKRVKGGLLQWLSRALSASGAAVRLGLAHSYVRSGISDSERSAAMVLAQPEGGGGRVWMALPAPLRRGERDALALSAVRVAAAGRDADAARTARVSARGKRNIAMAGMGPLALVSSERDVVDAKGGVARMVAETDEENKAMDMGAAQAFANGAGDMDALKMKALEKLTVERRKAWVRGRAAVSKLRRKARAAQRAFRQAISRTCDAEAAKSAAIQQWEEAKGREEAAEARKKEVEREHARLIFRSSMEGRPPRLALAPNPPLHTTSPAANYVFGRHYLCRDFPVFCMQKDGGAPRWAKSPEELPPPPHDPVREAAAFVWGPDTHWRPAREGEAPTLTVIHTAEWHYVHTATPAVLDAIAADVAAASSLPDWGDQDTGRPVPLSEDLVAMYHALNGDPEQDAVIRRPPDTLGPEETMSWQYAWIRGMGIPPQAMTPEELEKVRAGSEDMRAWQGMAWYDRAGWFAESALRVKLLRVEPGARAQQMDDLDDWGDGGVGTPVVPA